MPQHGEYTSRAAPPETQKGDIHGQPGEGLALSVMPSPFNIRDLVKVVNERWDGVPNEQRKRLETVRSACRYTPRARPVLRPRGDHRRCDPVMSGLIEAGRYSPRAPTLQATGPAHDDSPICGVHKAEALCN